MATSLPGKVKVAHLTTIDKSLQFILLNQLLAIQAEGFEVSGISSPGPHASAIASAGIRHIPLSIRREIAPFVDLNALLRLSQILRRERFTILHTHFSKPGFLGRLAARLAGVPLVIHTVHGFPFHEKMGPTQKRLYVLLEKIAAAGSDLILSQNLEDLSSAVREGICPPNKILHLGNGIDLSRFDPQAFPPAGLARVRRELGIPPAAPVVGFVGRLALQRKGFSAFLHAAGIIRQRIPGVIFLVLGEPDFGRPDAAPPGIARQFGLQEDCIFLGWVPNDRVPPLLSLMDVLVLPSLLEGMPRSLMEASAMGVPVVATAVKGNRAVVEPGRNGLLVPLGDVPALAAAVLGLLADPVRARRMGLEGRQLAREQFDERRVFKVVLSEYRRLLHEKGLACPS